MGHLTKVKAQSPLHLTHILVWGGILVEKFGSLVKVEFIPLNLALGPGADKIFPRIFVEISNFHKTDL